MKKIVTAFLCLTLCLFSLTFFGCGNDAFAGNYKEATKEDVTLYAQEVKNDGAKTTLDYSTGVEMKLFADTKVQYSDAESVAIKANINFKMGIVNDKLAMSGNMDITAEGQSGKTDVYYNNGYFYTKMSVAGIDAKIKYKMDVESAIDGNFDRFMPAYTDISLEEINLESLLAVSEKSENVKFYIESTEKGTKIKMVTVIPGKTDGSKAMTTTYYVLLDANKNLLGVKIESDSEYGKFNASIAPYGGRIDTPNDKDYADYSLVMK